MRRKKSRQRRVRKIDFRPQYFIWAFIVLVLIGGILFWSHRLSGLGLFKVDSIKANLEIDKRITKMAMGKSIFNVNIEDIYKQLQYRHPEFKDIKVQKIFPSTIKITVIRRRPLRGILSCR
jgi:cell division septal protein FtsQ